MDTVLVRKNENVRGLVSMDEAIELVEEAYAVNAGATNLLIQQRQITDRIDNPIFPVVRTGVTGDLLTEYRDAGPRRLDVPRQGLQGL